MSLSCMHVRAANKRPLGDVTSLPSGHVRQVEKDNNKSTKKKNVSWQSSDAYKSRARLRLRTRTSGDLLQGASKPPRACQSNRLQEEDKAKQFSGMTGEGGGAFFALRSCHQSLGGDGGEFFSPDYVCANPPLWCNWTIRAHAGMRVHLHLQDLTPDEDCHLKQDQIHVDEPPGPSAGHRVLRGCWHEATYTSRSDTLYVVLLIGGGPARQYRGFYARYRTFGPPMAYHPPDGISGQEGKRNSQIWDEFGAMIAVERELHPSATAAVFPLSDPPDKAADSSLEPDAHAPSWLETTPPSESPHGTSWAERGAPLMLSDPSDLARPSHELLNRPPGSSLHILNAKRRDADPGPNLPEGEQKTFEAGEKNMEAKETPTLSSPEEEPGWTLPHPNIVEPLSDHRGKLNVWNASQVLHEPGDRLFEVSVEVQLSQDHNQNQDHLDELLMKSVKALVLKHLDGLRIPLSLTFKRVKRLRAGCLYIMWLNAGRGRAHVYAGVHQDLHKLVGSAVARAGNLQHGVIASVSIGDVNECGTQLALCDVNADCLDQFGSYWCRCKDGFRDESHLGPRGTVCVERKPAGCTPGPSAETKAVYVLFFLLSSLLLTSLAAACALYRRHRRGAFLLAGRDSARADRGHAGPADSDLPPPPPPARGPRDAWTLQKVYT
ncbi:uncharacterized protein zgc:66455 isoform X2 [Phyllopteryx taeniolatus]|uniref:uncharacterized protein zgc:66455 isoform X2 n=1 Tax=Phyllopteryx taeniolatus TaxID=161469 RepID=UPI002AD2B790|nr:uncharacterized protein zgc:66455 isoform X2 [Phyllopteryx taeniolatus]